MGLPQLKEPYRYTYDDYCHWGEEVRGELIEGEFITMVPAPTVKHQKVVVELIRQVSNALIHSHAIPLVAPIDLRLPRLPNQPDGQIDTVVQPDLVVVCNPEQIDDRGIRGAPAWVVEVLSPSTALYDQTTKRDLYERHGVEFYWLVSPTDRTVMIYTLQQGQYGKPLIYGFDTPIAVTLGGESFELLLKAC